MKRRYEVLIILFIIVLTIPLARGRGLTETNFSVLGNRGSRRICFLLWGALVGSYLYLYIEETAELAKCADRTQEWLTRPGAGSISVWNWSALSHETGSPYGAYPRISVRGRNHSISVLHQASPYSAGTTIRDRVSHRKVDCDIYDSRRSLSVHLCRYYFQSAGNLRNPGKLHLPVQTQTKNRKMGL